MAFSVRAIILTTLLFFVLLFTFIDCLHPLFAVPQGLSYQDLLDFGYFLRSGVVTLRKL